MDDHKDKLTTWIIINQEKKCQCVFYFLAIVESFCERRDDLHSSSYSLSIF